MAQAELGAKKAAQAWCGVHAGVQERSPGWQARPSPKLLRHVRQRLGLRADALRLARRHAGWRPWGHCMVAGDLRWKAAERRASCGADAALTGSRRRRRRQRPGGATSGPVRAGWPRPCRL